jgi:virginiamycin B lyase
MDIRNKFSRGLIVLLVGAVAIALAATLLWRAKRPDGTTGDFIEYAMTLDSDIPTAVAIGPDDTVWFTIGFADAVGMIRDGKLQRLPKAKKNVEPVGLAVDAQGAAWFADPTEVQISRILPSGEIRSFPLDTPIARLGRLAVAPDGAVWFAESTGYGFTRLKDGALTRNVPKSVRGGPYGVAVDAHGVVWGTLQGGNSLVKIAPGQPIAEYEIPTPGSSPSDIAVDASGNAWFVEFRGNKVGKFGDGKFSEYPVPGDWAGLSGIVVAADGAVWFGMLRGHAIGRLRDGQFRIFELPRSQARPYTVAVDRNGNIWYADISGYVGMLKAGAASR